MHVIPVPFLIENRSGSFHLPNDFSVGYEDPCCESIAASLRDGLKQKHRISCHLTSSIPNPSIKLSLLETIPSLENFRNAKEGYEIVVSEQDITIEALSSHGLFYGVQTFLQLIPFDLDRKEDEQICIECLKIADAPRFGWRGALLDVGRHFFNVEFIKRFLDHLAFYKVNRFHWHLTEDQGWRLEIKSSPRLTEISSWRSLNGEKYGGFYTQKEVVEIVQYAKERFVEIIPEIEMPGHCAASLAAYPYLSCREDMSETPSEWGVYEDVYCAGKDAVFEFLEVVLEEVCALFPFEYIHIGGDETPKERWKSCQECQRRIEHHGLNNEDELQTWFISRIGEFLASKNKKIIGWDEILEGGLPTNATVMSWRGMIGGFIAAKLGHDVIMCPTSHCYLDYKQSQDSDEPGAFYAVLPLDGVYSFDPIPDAQYLLSQESSMNLSDSETSQKSQNEVEENGGNEQKDDTGVKPDEELGDGAAHRGIPKTLSESEEAHILGGQANVWTEYIPDSETCEYMLFPRICAFSEAVWSPKESKDWTDFSERVEEHVKLFEILGCSYRPLTKE